ncbi:MAG: ATP-binding protein [Pseudonocardia sediminis]
MDDVGVVEGTDGEDATWPAEARHLASIRAHTRHRLAGLGLDDDDVDDAVMAVNEAASNAVEHAYAGPGDGTVSMSVRAGPDEVRIDVADHGSWRTPPADNGNRGHGMPLMRGLVDTFSILHGPGGTLVSLGLARR